MNTYEQDYEYRLNKSMAAMQNTFDSLMLTELNYFKKHGHIRQPTEYEIFLSHLKLAKVDGKITLVHNQTMQAYRTKDPYTDKTAKQYALSYPITPINGTFEKWCSGFDL